MSMTETAPARTAAGQAATTTAAKPPGPEADSLQAYREYLQSVAAARNAETVILNRTIGHAAVVVEVIFGQSRKRVRVVTRILNPGLYGEPGVVAAAIKFLKDNPDAILEILCENKIADDQIASHLFLAALRTAGLIRKVRLSWVHKDDSDRYPFNFAVGDGLYFRFEQDRKEMDAIVQLGDATLGARLDAIFEKLDERAERYPLS